MRSAARYLIALVAGLVLSFIFTEAIPFLALGEGAIETDFGTAVILAVAGLLPALAVGWIVLRGGLPAILVALVAGVATPTVYLLGLIDRPQGQQLLWPTFLVPTVATVAAGALEVAGLRHS